MKYLLQWYWEFIIHHVWRHFLWLKILFSMHKRTFTTYKQISSSLKSAEPWVWIVFISVMRDLSVAHRQEDRRDDTMTEMEKDRTGWERKKPKNPSLFRAGYGILNEDRRRVHISRLYYWKWLIYSEEIKTGRKTDERDMESSGDWHSIFLNSNPITSPEFPYG